MQSNPVSRHSQPKLSHGDILNVVLVYAIFAASWILLSDKTVEWLFSDPAQITTVSIVKGWLYIGITSLLLYSLMHRWISRESEPVTLPVDSRRIVLLFVMLAALIVTLTVVGVISVYIHHKKNATDQLHTIADFKSQQIADWLREREADANFIQSSFYVTEQYQLWQESGNIQSSERLKSRLKQFCKDWRFSGITLLNPKGTLLWRTEKTLPNFAPALQRAIQLAATEQKMLRLDPYRDPAGNAQLDFVLPLPHMPKPSPVIILHANLENWLIPSLQSSPFSGANNEKLVLFRFENNEVFDFNEPPNINISKANPDSPEINRQLLTRLSSRNTLTSESIEGLDSHGIKQIGMVSAVPDTDWFLLTKINRSEIYKEALGDMALVGFVGLMSLFISVSGFFLLIQNQKLIMAQAVHESQAERLNALNLLATIADSSSDAIFAKDLIGRYILFNQAACDFVGKQTNEVLGNDDHAIFPAEQAEMLMESGRRVVAENRAQTVEEVLDTKNGERVFLSTKGPLHNSEGNIIGIFGISRDITAMKQVEKSLRDSEERFRLALDATNDGLWDWDLSSGLAYLSPHYYKITGYRPEEVTPDFDFFKRLVYPEDLDGVMIAISDHLQEKIAISEFDYRLVTRDGKIKWMRGRGKVVERDAAGQPKRMIGTISDISSLKFAEESLHRQTEALEQNNAELERFNRSMVGRELDMISLKQQVNELSCQLGKKPPFAMSFLDTAASDTLDPENTA